MKILVINGANLDLLGKRDPVQYGNLNLANIEQLMRKHFPEDDFYFFQSNIEGDIVGKLHEMTEEGFEGLIINPGGYAHTSVVIRDALEMLNIPKIEVHLSNLAAREPFRQVLITAGVCNGYISGLKEIGYIAAVNVLHNLINRR